MKTLSIGIGILAHNEEESIKATIDSLFKQSIFFAHQIDRATRLGKLEIIVVPNGCTDDTVGIARRELDLQTLKTKESSKQKLQVNAEVKEIELASKANAWNKYIHEFSENSLDLIVMIDADIEFNQIQTISNSIKALLDNREAEIAVDTPLKSIHRKTKKNLLDRISLRVSKEYLGRDLGVAGSFYCSRSTTLRQIWMPVGLPGEDGFLKAMIITDMFRSKPSMKKIIRAEDASHYYVPETSIKGIVKHELRLIVGTSINCYLTWDFLLFATDPKGPGAGVVLKNLVEKQPDWLRQFLNNTLANKGFWVLPRGMVTKKLRSLKGKNLIREYKTYLVVTLRFMFDLPLFIMANQKIKKGKAIGFW